MQYSTGMKASVTNNGTLLFGRTSKNTWVARESSPIIDAIYRRAVDLLQIDEALMRKRSKDEEVDLETTSTRVTEKLQLVHYGVGEEYKAHHDFPPAPLWHKDQPMRYATILLYLNDSMTGGETSFPRWMNAETEDALKVVPQKGKAILFYNMLPDGNMDDRSHHAGLPVLSGEKWLSNLWVWSPYYYDG
jgi:prolyl 4-hydroxylase